MRDVRPLKRSKPPKPPRAPQKPRRTGTADAKTPDESRSRAKPVPKDAAAAAAPPAPVGGGLDRRTAERLRRGKLEIDARVDLHGHTQANAHRVLHAFVRTAHERGRRTLLVITGKGGPRTAEDSDVMPHREVGVLRRNVPRWLNEPAVKPLILAVQTARPQHGGEGAYYVLLRRKR